MDHEMGILVRQRKKGPLGRPVLKIGIAITASAVMSAGAASLLMAGGSGPVMLPYAMTAAINTSNTTVGFADSDIYAMSPADIDRTLEEMQAMGVQNVRILIPWSNIEVLDDVYYWNQIDYVVNAAYERNMGIVGDITSTPGWATVPGQPANAGAPASPEEYAEFAGLVAERYAGKISAYEIYNEPNTVFFWSPKPDPAAYTEVLQAGYTAIKAADPNATVIGGVLISATNYGDQSINPVNYLQGMYDAGAAGYFDALSFHPYHYSLPFSQGRPWGDMSAINQMDLMHQLMVANGDGDKLIWATEYGQSTAIVDEAGQAAFISDFLNSWSQIDYAGPSFIYTTRDRNSDSTVVEDTHGVLRDDWTWKQAAYVIQQWTATHPQTAPSTVTLAAATATEPTTTTSTTSTSAVAPMEATTVPESTVTAPASTTETSTAPTATATPEPTATAAPEPSSSTSTTDSTSTGSTGSTSTGSTSTGSTSTGSTSSGTTSTTTDSTSGSTSTGSASGGSTSTSTGSTSTSTGSTGTDTSSTGSTSGSTGSTGTSSSTSTG
jgi:hypothetical protein